MYARSVTRPPDVSEITRHRAFRDGDSELQQLAMDPRSAPEAVLRGHAADKRAQFRMDGRSSRPPARATTPVLTESFATPTNDRCRLDEHERRVGCGNRIQAARPYS